MHFILHKLNQLNQLMNLPNTCTPLSVHFYADYSGAIEYREHGQTYVVFEFENMDELNHFLTVTTFGGECVGI